MIVKPKEYSSHELGGYLLKNVKFMESLFIYISGYGSSFFFMN